MLAVKMLDSKSTLADLRIVKIYGGNRLGHHRDIECRLSWKTSTDTEHRSSGLTDVSLKDLTLSARRARIFGFNLASVEMGGHRIQASKERN